jgi:Holliday junction resolvase RusA-like endonuclease
VTTWRQLSFDGTEEIYAPGPKRVTVVVAGVPVTQGSMKAFTVGGQAIVDAVHRQLGESIDLYTGPVRLSAAFRLPRPKTLPKRRRTWPTGARSGDADKFLRCLGDALTGVLIADDSLIVDARVTKDYAEAGAQPGVIFTLEEIDG